MQANMKLKTVVTITGIRPDFIRMANIFKLLDDNFNHILIHTGQHYDALLSDVFFQDLNIRKPDYVLATGLNSSTHYEQLAYLSVEIFRLFDRENIKPDLILFLGDANTAAVSMPLKKEGYMIGHIEGGMRSYDKRMLEEINRTVCDHCSDIIFVYHDDYAAQLAKENITRGVYVVGNTIREMCEPFVPCVPKLNNLILLDVHRPENFKYKIRLVNIIKYANDCASRYKLPVHMLKFNRTLKCIQDFGIDLGNVKVVDLMAYKEYLTTVYNCKFLISDSGTGQEEPALLKTPVIVPRDYTERPQSIQADCSYMLDVNNLNPETWARSFEWVESDHKFDIEWLGDGHTSDHIIDVLKTEFFAT